MSRVTSIWLLFGSIYYYSGFFISNVSKYFGSINSSQTNSSSQSQWIPVIFGLLGVIAGGLITAFSNYFLENKRLRNDLDKRALSEAYVPLCTVIEEFEQYCSATMQALCDVSGKRVLLDMWIEDELEPTLSKLRESATASVRWHFATKDREKLDEVVNILKGMDENLYNLYRKEQKIAVGTELMNENLPGIKGSFDDFVYPIISKDFDAFSQVYQKNPEFEEDLKQSYEFLTKSFTKFVNEVHTLYLSLIKSIDKITGR